MNKLKILIILLLAAFEASTAQNAEERLKMFRTSVLPMYNVYFTAAELSSEKQLSLAATTDYNLLSPEGKKNMMDKLLRSWSETLVIVNYESKRELWAIDTKTQKVLLLENWDRETGVALQQKPPQSNASSKTAQHPWFFYLGANELVDSNKNINIAFSTSVGFFLLKNRWDLAATFNGSISGNFGNESDISGQTGIGLQSKVYFPIEKYKISPNIGFELANTRYSISETTTNSFTPSLITGISWYVGIGSLDLSFRIGKQSVVMLGYTFIPRMKSAK